MTTKNEQNPVVDSSPWITEEYKNMREDYLSFSKEKFEVFKLFNTTMIALSTAFIAGTIAYINSNKIHCFSWLLYMAWGLFTLALLLSIWELFFSQIAYEKSMDNLAISYKEHDYERPLSNPYGRICWWMILGSTILLSGAVLLTTVFLAINTSKNGESAMTKEDRPLQKSFPSPLPPRPSATVPPPAPTQQTPPQPTPSAPAPKNP